ncbi:DUF5783 family protein [Halocatena pleomorpha]|uniref:Uncharacterized protein n=1 Tax=Halocatena pleomorpha TaxID=1785090 RepID=A0A3P3RB90_9EURY|nr:DUF5783 family protein [Halocatena pleomorpha]RRJ30716.1 hypothetical protein EIK79_08775 [Halocatena pleomorpha]
MTEFDPERFEDKYVHYFPELQEAYKRAFETMNEAYDSQLIHAIDQQVLNESEPFYDDGFTIDLPENPTERVSGVVVSDEKLTRVLDRYVTELRRELAAVFDLETAENRHEK